MLRTLLIAAAKGNTSMVQEVLDAGGCPNEYSGDVNACLPL